MSSLVRKQLGLAFPGETREKDRVLIADIEVRGLAREVWYLTSAMSYNSSTPLGSAGTLGEMEER